MNYVKNEAQIFAYLIQNGGGRAELTLLQLQATIALQDLPIGLSQARQ